MDREIYGVNRFYQASKPIIEHTEWFFHLDEAEFATTQGYSSKHIISAIYHDSTETEEPWIEITGMIS